MDDRMTSPDLRWSCHRKVRYGTEQEARRSLRTIRERGSVDGPDLHAYPCLEGCGGWHLGHPIGTRSQAPRGMA